MGEIVDILNRADYDGKYGPYSNPNVRKSKIMTKVVRSLHKKCGDVDVVEVDTNFNSASTQILIVQSIYTLMKGHLLEWSMCFHQGPKRSMLRGMSSRLPKIYSELCKKCPENEWPNQAKTICIDKVNEYLSYEEDILVLFFSITSVIFSTTSLLIFGLFVWFRSTPIVRANNRNLSFILLLSLILSFLSVFLFLGHPVDITCMLQQVTFGIPFTISASSILAKTIMVFIAFKATRPGSSYSKWVGVKLPNTVMLFCSSIQVMNCILWLSISPPFQEYDMDSYPGKILIQCNEGSVIGFYSMLGYMGFLAAVSFVLAFMVRTLPDSFNEAKYITFSMLVFCSVWIAMIPAYLSTRGKYMVAVEIFAILTSSAGILLCMFSPKLYILLLKPELNTRGTILGKRML
ncbi:vomeronasal type-2 receptor 26-like [Lithobates pipiens]